MNATNVIINGAGATIAKDLYLPYGDVRYQWRSGTTVLQTQYRYTSQRMETGVAAPATTWNGVAVDRGLYFYGARWYDHLIGRCTQPDTIVPNPGNPGSLNRYSYVLNNPIKYRDPTGHWVETAFDVISLGMTINDIRNEGFTLGNTVALITDAASVALPIVPAGASHAIRAGKLANKAVNVASHADEAMDAVRLAGHMGDGAHAVLTASLLRQAGANSSEGARLVRALAEASTRNGRIQNGMTMLGSYDEYINMAKLEGLTYFNMPSEAWDILKTTPDLAWEVNRQFLDDSIAAGHRFVVTYFPLP